MPSFSTALSLGQITNEEAVRFKSLIKGIYSDKDYLPISLLVCRVDEEDFVVHELKLTELKYRRF